MSFQVFVLLPYVYDGNLCQKRHKWWFCIFPLVQGCVKPRLEDNWCRLDLADVINGKLMCCIQNLLTYNNLCIHEYFHIAICFKRQCQLKYFTINLTHSLFGNLVHFYGHLFFSRSFSTKWVLILLLIHYSTFIFYCVIYLYNHDML